jgi:hypothetical protein
MIGLFSLQSPHDRSEAGRPGSLRCLLRGLAPSEADRRSGRLRRFSQACTTLDGARVVIERGWVQDRWYAPRSATAEGTGRGVPAACLVGAVMVAAGEGRPDTAAVAAGPAIDALWDAWQETRGMLGPGVAGWAAAPAVRAARVRDLARWNDQPGRTRDEVLALIDLASSRAIMEAMQPVGAHR